MLETKLHIKTKNKAVVMHILIFVFLDDEREDQRFSTER
jgi:hypothetical protein